MRICLKAMTLFLGISSATSGALAEEAPLFRYFTPFEYVLNDFEAGKDMAGYKMCTSSSWTLESSGYPERLAGVTPVVMKVFEAIAQPLSRVCDFSAIRWDAKEHRAAITKELDSWGMKEIPSLTKN